jgi:Rrf2 family protein
VLTQKSKYGLKALLRMAREPERAMLASEIAEAEQISKKFLQLILLDLKRRGMVKSRRGKRGGYQLARPPSEIHLGAVMRALEGPLALTPCASETAYHRCDECADELACGIQLVMRQVRDATAAILEGATLDKVNAAVDARVRSARGKRNGP